MAFGPTKKSSADEVDQFGTGPSASKSFFGKTMKINGEIASDEDLTVEGKVDGRIKVGKTLSIGQNGYVKGEISASVVRLSGEAEGRLEASEKLDISAEGKYNGSIKADKLVVAEGAQIKGTINLTEEPKKTETPGKPTKDSTKESPKESPKASPKESAKGPVQETTAPKAGDSPGATPGKTT